MMGGVAVVGVQAGAWGARWFVVADNHEVAALAGDATGQLWVVTTHGRLAGQGLLECPAESMDPVAMAGHGVRLHTETCTVPAHEALEGLR
jgi:hypothetical protein